jgi:hypothetical protein
METVRRPQPVTPHQTLKRLMIFLERWGVEQAAAGMRALFFSSSY